MIETLTNLKHNRPKALNGADSSLQGTEEQFKRHLKTWMRTASGASLDPIHVGLDELRQAESRGKWWVVGNAWAGDPLMEQQQKEDAQDASTTTGASHSQAKWLKLARKQGMNTTVRQSIFVALMGSEVRVLVLSAYNGQLT